MATKREAARNPRRAGAGFAAEPVTSGGSLTDRVTEALLEMIQTGALPPQSRLPSEQAMGEKFGVSRTVIREAVSRLKSEGLVETRQGSGAFVRRGSGHVPFRISVNADSVQSVLRVMELRHTLESEIAALAAERHNAKQLAVIRKALDAIGKANRAGKDAASEDVAYHIAIARATGNSLFPDLLTYLSRNLRGAVRVLRKHESRRPDFTDQVCDEHKAIFAAIAARDVAGARQAAGDHLSNAATRFESAGAAVFGGPTAEAAASRRGSKVATGGSARKAK